VSRAICQQCRERPASYHVTRVVDGQTVQDLHLCERCAAERGEFGAGMSPHLPEPLPIQGLLASLLAGLGEATPGTGPAVGEAAGTEPLRCPHCGHTYAEFARTGLLGCPECYRAFAGRLLPLIRRIHGKSRHEGKVPLRGAGDLRKRRELEELRRELAAAVAEQAFERAAVLRDRIRAMEAELAAGQRR
jgi:protein arginine kinase activator